ncbi:MAG: hypothetical protein ABIJ53_07405 [Verrucomicrobiota bacterium]
MSPATLLAAIVMIAAPAINIIVLVGSMFELLLVTTDSYGYSAKGNAPKKWRPTS